MEYNIILAQSFGRCSILRHFNYTYITIRNYRRGKACLKLPYKFSKKYPSLQPKDISGMVLNQKFVNQVLDIEREINRGLCDYTLTVFYSSDACELCDKLHTGELLQPKVKVVAILPSHCM